VFVFRFLESLRAAREENAEHSWRWIDPVAWLSWAYFHLFFVLQTPIRRQQEYRADGFGAAAFGGEFAAQTLLKDWVLGKQFQETLQRFLHTIPRKTSETSNIFRQFAKKYHELKPQGQEMTPQGRSQLEEGLRAQENPSFWDLHPTVYQRMQNMRRYIDRELPEPMPAYLLLRDVDKLESRLQEQLDAQQSAFPRNYVE
jgi:Zn-dependent protease with chaperone function